VKTFTSQRDGLDAEGLAVRALTLATRTAFAVVGPNDDARDVAQDVVARVLERNDQLRDPEKFDAWVHRIAIREALKARRIRSRRYAAETDLDAYHDAQSGSEHDPVDAIAAAHTARAALDALGERERLAMVLRYVHDLPDSQIAKVLGCRRGTVNSLLSRARARLRAMPELESNGRSSRGGRR